MSNRFADVCEWQDARAIETIVLERRCLTMNTDFEVDRGLGGNPGAAGVRAAATENQRTKYAPTTAGAI